MPDVIFAHESLPQQLRSFKCYAFDGVEGISRLYAYRVILRQEGGKPFTSDEIFALACETIGKEIAFSIISSQYPPPLPTKPAASFDSPIIDHLPIQAQCIPQPLPDLNNYFHGIILGFQVEETGGLLLHIGPCLAQARHTVRSRTFVGRSIRQIIESVLTGHGVYFDISKDLACTPVPLSVQFQESDADYIQRLLEENSLFYFFKHEGPTGGNSIQPGKHTMIIRSFSPGLQHGIKRHAQLIIDSTGDETFPFLDKWELRRSFVSGNVVVLGCHAETTAKAHQARTEVPGTTSAEKRCQQTETIKIAGDRTTVEQFARRRAEAENAERIILHSGGNLLLRPAEAITRDLKLSSTGGNTEYFSLVVQHSAQEAFAGLRAGYYNCFQAIPRNTPFVPKRSIMSPVIDGPQRATVVHRYGATGCVDIDEHARVFIRFGWDQNKNLIPVRLAAPCQGMASPPQVGQQVEVLFENLNLPIIVGIVPDREAPPHDPSANGDCRTTRIPSNPSGKKESDTIVQVDTRQNQQSIAVQAPGSFFQRVGKLFMLLVGADYFLRTRKSGHVHAEEEIVVEAGKKISFKVGDNYIVMSTDGIYLVTPSGKIYLNCPGGPQPSSSQFPEDQGHPR